MNNISSLLTNELYPKSEYAKCDKKEALHFQVAYNPEAHMEWIKKQKNSFCLLDRHGFAPIHIAALKANQKMVDFFLQEKVPLALRDIYGCNIAHHAALSQNKPFIAWVKALDANGELVKATNTCGQTPTDLELSLSRTPAQPGDKVFNYLNPSTGTIHYQATAQKFKELTGASFTKYTICTPASLLKNLKDSSSHNVINLNSFQAKAYQEYIKNPPVIYLAECPEIDGYGVFADQEISIDQMITTYEGDLCLLEEANDLAYHVCNRDAERCRNMGPMINDGFPNAQILTRFISPNGEQLIGVVATRKILRGEQILIDYGYGHRSKRFLHHEFNMAELENAFTHTKLLDQVKEFLRLRAQLKTGDDQTALDIAYRYQGLLYVFCTPSALVHLITKKILSTKECKLVSDKNNITYSPFAQLLPDYIVCLIESIDACEEELQKAGLLPAFYEWFNTFAKTATLITLNYALVYTPSKLAIQGFGEITKTLDHAKTTLNAITLLQYKLTCKDRNDSSDILKTIEIRLSELPDDLGIFVWRYLKAESRILYPACLSDIDAMLYSLIKIWAAKVKG